MTYQQQPSRPHAQPPKKEKIHPLVVVLVLAMVIAAVVYAYIQFKPALDTTALITSGTLGTRYSGDALIVRNETPYDAEGVTSVDYEAEEGTLVYRGITICQVYSSGFNTREMNALQNYRDQIRNYQLELLSKETTFDARMAQLEGDVVTLAAEVRQMLTTNQGNLGNQERMLDAAIAARQQYLSRKYSDNQRLNRLYDDEQSQLQRIESWTKTYTATSDSLVSFYSDGYEYGLNTTNYMNFTPQEVRRMIQGQKPEKSTIDKGKTTIYRTVQDGTWYVLLLVRNALWNPTEGQTYELKLERFENTQVTGMVESFTRSGGELLVRLKVTSEVYPVLYMRSCQAEIGDNVASLCVPRRALYTHNGVLGVVVLDGASKVFTPIQILREDKEELYISAIQNGHLYEGMTVMLF